MHYGDPAWKKKTVAHCRSSKADKRSSNGTYFLQISEIKARMESFLFLLDKEEECAKRRRRWMNTSIYKRVHDVLFHCFTF